MFSNIKSKITYHILQKELSKKNRKPKVIRLSDTKKIALLFDAKSSNDIIKVKSLLKYFLNKNIDVDVLGFVEKNKMEDIHLSSLHINYFNLKDLNFIGIPNSKKLKNFMSKKYDFLINLSLDNSFPTKYLAFKSISKFKIGVFLHGFKCGYDFMFNLKIKSLDYFLEHLVSYLELIDRNNAK